MSYVSGREVYTGFWWGNTSEMEHLEDQGVDVRIILRWTFRKWDGGVDWIDLAQKRDRWWVLGIAVMYLRVPQNSGNSLTS
jgi:hypothetical protein